MEGIIFTFCCLFVLVIVLLVLRLFRHINKTTVVHYRVYDDLLAANQSLITTFERLQSKMELEQVIRNVLDRTAVDKIVTNKQVDELTKELVDAIVAEWRNGQLKPPEVIDG